MLWPTLSRARCCRPDLPLELATVCHFKTGCCLRTLKKILAPGARPKERWWLTARRIADALGVAARVKSHEAQCWVWIVAALLLRLLLSPPIWHRAEAREGIVVQNIVGKQQWILPFRNGELPSKPPLFHWLAALPALILGPNDFIVRLPSAMGELAMAFTVFLIGRAMGSRRIGWLAFGALLGMYEFWGSGTRARVDMVFSACITVSVAGFFFWHRDKRQLARTICYIACACAVLAKGRAGLALPVLVIGGFFGGREPASMHCDTVVLAPRWNCSSRRYRLVRVSLPHRWK